MSGPRHDARARIRTGANWFYWVAGVSALNSYFAHTGGSLTFFIGLGITQLFDAMAVGYAAAPLVLLVNALLISSCAMVGFYARDSRGLYLTGMVLYALDSLLFVLFQDPLAIAFHLFALYWMFIGIRGFGLVPATEMAGSEGAASPSAV